MQTRSKKKLREVSYISMITINEENIVDRQCRNCEERAMKGQIVRKSKTSENRKRKYLSEEFLSSLIPFCSMCWGTLHLNCLRHSRCRFLALVSGCDHWLFLLVRYARVSTKRFLRGLNFGCLDLFLWLNQQTVSKLLCLPYSPYNQGDEPFRIIV